MMIRLLLLLLVSCATSSKPVMQQDAILNKIADSAERKHYYAYASFLREKYLSSHPNDVVTMKSLAKDLEHANNWQKSLFYLHKIAKQQPNDLRVKLQLAHAYLHVRAWAKAYAYYKQVLALAPSIEAYNGMGVILNAAKQFKHANICFDVALALAPNDEASINNKALTLALMGDKKAAKTSLTNLALIYPNSAYSANLNNLSQHNLWHYIFGTGFTLKQGYNCKRRSI